MQGFCLFASVICALATVALYVVAAMIVILLAAGESSSVFHETEAILGVGLGSLSLAASALCGAASRQLAKREG